MFWCIGMFLESVFNIHCFKCLVQIWCSKVKSCYELQLLCQVFIFPSQFLQFSAANSCSRSSSFLSSSSGMFPSCSLRSLQLNQQDYISSVYQADLLHIQHYEQLIFFFMKICIRLQCDKKLSLVSSGGNATDILCWW